MKANMTIPAGPVARADFIMDLARRVRADPTEATAWRRLARACNRSAYKERRSYARLIHTAIKLGESFARET